MGLFLKNGNCSFSAMTSGVNYNQFLAEHDPNLQNNLPSSKAFTATSGQKQSNLIAAAAEVIEWILKKK